MAEERRGDHGQCLSAGTVMALLDEQLDDRERADALFHLESCAHCQTLSRELGAASSAVASHLACLDDESIAAYVDDAAGRVRGALSRAETGRIRAHLAECASCRGEAEALARDSAMGTGVLGWLRSLTLGAGTGRAQLVAPALRWATVTAIAVAAILVLWVGLQRDRQGGPSDGTRLVVEAPDQLQAAPPDEHTGIPDSGSHEADGSQRPAPTGERSPAGVEDGDTGTQQSILPPAQAALVPDVDEIDGALARALADLARAKEAGRVADEAVAAAKAAGLRHKVQDHEAAIHYYRQAAAAAERAGRHELQVDSLVLAGAALAELGSVRQARGQLEEALRLARDAGYTKGEQNALIQIGLLDELSASEASTGEGED